MRISPHRLGLGLALALGIVVSFLYLNHASTNTSEAEAPASAPYGYEEYTDGSMSRQDYDRMRLSNPVTGSMPNPSGNSSSEFVRHLVDNSSGWPITRDEDWASLGPFEIGGRTTSIGIDVRNENVLLAGGETSGMFKSTDGGASWYKTSSSDNAQIISALAQNEASGHEDTWYYASGDRTPPSINAYGAALRGIITATGDGIYKSVDGGESWSQLASTASATPSDDDPFNYVWELETFGTDGVLAATSRGIYRSTNGGESWTETLDFGTSNAEVAADLAQAADGTFFATVGGDTEQNGIYQSDDGVNWQPITPEGWNTASVRTAVAVAQSNSNVAYFFTEVAPLQQELRRYEAGTGWTDLSANLPYNAQIQTYGGKLLVIAVKPDAENTLFLGAINFLRSTDGGQSWELIGQDAANFYVDQFEVVFYPSNPAKMLVGNDGGIYRTDNNLETAVADKITWSPLNSGYLATQFYSVAVDHGTVGSEAVAGGMQDRGVGYSAGDVPASPWQRVVGGDGGSTEIVDGGSTYYSSAAATLGLYRIDIDGDNHTRTNVTPEGALLGLWLSIFQLDPFDQKVMYFPSQQTLYRNSDLTAIPHTTPGNPTNINWDTFENVTGHYIHSLGMSDASPRRLYYSASDISALADERVFYIDNPQSGQPTPVDITGENFPLYPYSPFINCIAVDPRDPQKVVVVFSSGGVLSLFSTENGGGSWEPVSGNLEENPDGTGAGPSVRWLSILYVDDKPVYLAGTNAGLFSSTSLDGMNTEWTHEAGETIGNQVVEMIDVRQSDGFVAVATYGNGVYGTYITDTRTGADETDTTPSVLTILTVHPNPFADTATLSYSLPRPGFVSAKVFDLLGREIATVFEGSVSAGQHTIRWNAGSTASGTYLMRLDFGGQSVSRQVVLQR